MNRWRTIGLVLGAAGLADAVYLASESLNPQIPLYCPAVGLVNCGYVTSSTYSRFAGVPVAVLGVGWFALMFALVALDRPGPNYALIPLWLLGVVSVGYLASIEAFVVHSICPYCTFAHVAGLLMGVPAFKLALAD